MKLPTKLIVLLLFSVFISGCGQQAASPAITKAPPTESRWLLVDDGKILKISLDKQSITRNKETGTNVTQDATKYKLTRRDIITCWIKVDIKEEYRANFIAEMKKNKPKLKIENVTHSLENVHFDLLTREFKVDEEIIFDGSNELARNKVHNNWQKLVPGDDYYEPVFEAVKKQLSIK